MEIEYRKIRSSWVHQSNWNSTTPWMFTSKGFKSTLGFCWKNVVMENASFVRIFHMLYAILLVMLKFEMSTVHRQKHSFMTNEWVLLWKCQSFDVPCFGILALAVLIFLLVNVCYAIHETVQFILIYDYEGWYVLRICYKHILAALGLNGKKVSEPVFGSTPEGLTIDKQFLKRYSAHW